MTPCPACSSAISPGSRFCAACGASLLDASSTPTILPALPPEGAPPRAAPRQSTGPSGQAGAPGTDPSGGARVLRAGSPGGGGARFLPGSILADRYRIAGLLGKGGMGEVYRADDMKLGQTVALKLLPASLGASPAMLDRFYSEVRIARQISHPNVCRVYDVGEVDSIHYISMEFIDGEDLASLLRRIGRLPGDKAVEISRQICAGLAAAHDKGVLHRDLKPANVMIDGRGHARIADFGLAGVADEIRGAEIRSGTPAYMAPEQLAGREVSVRSDIFALGLVLYELFTGRRAFEAESIEQLRGLHQSSSVTTPSSHVRELEPAVERVILRCLEQDPAGRPQSALAVSAALPGGDPLAAALAAGETPSPEMVAAAGEEGAIGPLAAWSVFGAFAAMMIGVALLSGSASFFELAGVQKPPQALEDRARSLLEALGYTDLPVDHAGAYAVRGDVVRWLAQNDAAPTWRERLSRDRPAGVLYWYRQSPRRIVPFNGMGEVSWWDPPEAVSGMATVFMDTTGRLLELRVVPPQVEPEGDARSDAEPDWSALLAASDLDPAALAPAEPSWTPPSWSDSRAAWVGRIEELPGVPIRVEAAGYRGLPVWFRIIGPWSRAERMQASEQGMGLLVGQTLFVVFLIAALTAAAILARRNLRMGRGDQRGAIRIAVYLLAGLGIARLIGADHVAEVGAEWLLIVRSVGGSLFDAGFCWILYIAIEPLIRRRWPEGIIAWTRLLAGRPRDPLVGKEILAGCLAGAAIMVLDRCYRVLPGLAGLPTPAPNYDSAMALAGPAGALAEILFNHLAGVIFAMLLMFFFFLGSIRGRNLIGALVFMAIFTTMDTLFRGGDPMPASLALAVLSGLIATTIYYRFGLLSAAVMFFFDRYEVPITLDFGAWYAGHTILPFLLLFVLAGWAAWTAQGRRAVAPAVAIGAAAGAAR